VVGGGCKQGNKKVVSYSQMRGCPPIHYDDVWVWWTLEIIANVNDMYYFGANLVEV